MAFLATFEIMHGTQNIFLLYPIYFII